MELELFGTKSKIQWTESRLWKRPQADGQEKVGFGSPMMCLAMGNQEQETQVAGGSDGSHPPELRLKERTPVFVEERA